MPPSNPGGLEAAAYTNIVAYLMQANGAPASEAAITASTSERLGKDLPGQAAVLTAPEVQGPTGVMVAGTVRGFVPVTAFAIVTATGNIYAGLWYPIAFTLISALTLPFLLPETRGRSIDV